MLTINKLEPNNYDFPISRHALFDHISKPGDSKCCDRLPLYKGNITKPLNNKLTFANSDQGDVFVKSNNEETGNLGSKLNGFLQWYVEDIPHDYRYF